jgi:hypothetical protein
MDTMICIALFFIQPSQSSMDFKPKIMYGKIGKAFMSHKLLVWGPVFFQYIPFK